MRVYREIHGRPNASLWYEVEPDRFYCAVDIKEAKDFRDGLGDSGGLPLTSVDDGYGPLTLVSTDENYTDLDRYNPYI